MPWHIESDNPDCDGWAVVKDDDGAIEGCHTSEQAAADQIAALMMAESNSEAEPKDELGDDERDPDAILELEYAGRSGKSSLAIVANPNPRAAREGKDGIEFRRGTLELREANGGDGFATLGGHASTFDDPYTVTDMFGDYEEVVRAGAFDRTIAEQDVRLYVDHEGLALARSSAGNLELREDPIGLAYEARVDTSITVVSDLVKLMRAGVMRESSFAFQPIRQKWNSDYSRRELLEVKLYDVSVVSFPANPSADAAVRSAALIRWLGELEPRELADDLELAGVGSTSALEAIARLAHAEQKREGKVLSSSNAKLVRDAIDALSALLEAAEPGSRDAGGMMIEAALLEVVRRRR